MIRVHQGMDGRWYWQLQGPSVAGLSNKVEDGTAATKEQAMRDAKARLKMLKDSWGQGRVNPYMATRPEW